MTDWRALLCVSLLASSCDNRQAFHQPEPSLERMLLQPRGSAYGQSSVFADGRVMRTPPEDTVPAEREWLGQPLVETGRSGADYASRIPLPVTLELLERGHTAFDRACATCHGVLGDGHSLVAEKMELRKPPSLHEPRIVALAPGKVFNVVSEGYGLMPSYAFMLGVEERWAVIAYLDALRLSQHAEEARLPASLRAELRREAP